MRNEVESPIDKGTLKKVYEIREIVVTLLAHKYMGQVLIFHIVKDKFLFYL